jgi:hypothetical protein
MFRPRALDLTAGTIGGKVFGLWIKAVTEYWSIINLLIFYSEAEGKCTSILAVNPGIPFNFT